tara:strand:- start:333 stop:563 length:231 start_codon:yes stop_codon:yes gene_type:complete
MNQETINDKNLDRFDKINERLTRIEESLEHIAGFFYRHSNYIQESGQVIERIQGLAEEMYENRTGLDVITGEKLDE